jgi:hypothetical protein
MHMIVQPIVLLLLLVSLIVVVTVIFHVIHSDRIRIDHRTANLGVIVFESDVRLHRLDKARCGTASWWCSSSVVFPLNGSHRIRSVSWGRLDLLVLHDLSSGLGLRSNVARPA